jgi:ADP-L-glycero-D-manno-heptose 6-epimerase
LDKNSLIVVTGASGFIGSCMVSYLNKKGYTNLVLVDEFSEPAKELNLRGKLFTYKIDRELFFRWLQKESIDIKFVFHLGARTDTTEFDYSVHQHFNVDYSKKMWHYCAEHNTPLVYASSAATYGMGEHGFKDDHDVAEKLEPLNPYGVSKNEFDKWALGESENSNVKSEKSIPPFWAGLKFFNVYGPNEYHKGRMASVIFHSFNRINETGKAKLFRSHHADYKDGAQLRDFIYVEDVIKMCYWFMNSKSGSVKSGLYNIGSGNARTFNDLVLATFAAMKKDPVIEFIDIPEDIREKYQYFTEADMVKMRAAGYNEPMYSLENGIADYVRSYLIGNKYY